MVVVGVVGGSNSSCGTRVLTIFHFPGAMISKMIFLIFFGIFFISNSCFGANILYLVPLPAKSHYILGEKLVKELAGRGHEITIISSFKMSNPPKNIKEIIMPASFEDFGCTCTCDKQTRKNIFFSPSCFKF